MVRIFGWVQVFGNPREDCLAIIEDKVSEFSQNHFFYSSKVLHGVKNIQISANYKRYNSEVPKLLELIELIQVNTDDDSFGLFYFQDEEDITMANNFKVYKLSKGNLTIEKDPFFSPVS